MPIINESNREAITELVVRLRDENVKWDIEGGIRDQVAEAFPVYTSKSAIPLRKLYHAAKEAKFNPKTKSGAVKLVKLRDQGFGWGHLNAVTGVPIGELKKLYTEGGGTNPTGGRLYVAQDGSVNHVAESTMTIFKRKQAEGKPADQAAEEAVKEDGADASAEQVEEAAKEEAPKPKRRRRRQAA